MNHGIFNVWSSSNLVLFTQTVYLYTRYSKYHFYYYEEEIMKLFYKGELCSETTTNNIIFYIIFGSYVYALFLKVVNTTTVYWEGIKVEAKVKDTTVEEITRERYFYFYVY